MTTHKSADTGLSEAPAASRFAAAVANLEPLDRVHRIAHFAEAIEMLSFDPQEYQFVKILGTVRELAESILEEAEIVIEAMENDEDCRRAANVSVG